jgi:RNA polymerase sigma factor (sigma-70 family)
MVDKIAATIGVAEEEYRMRHKRMLKQFEGRSGWQTPENPRSAEPEMPAAPAEPVSGDQYLELRARRLLEQPIEFIYNESFEDPAQESIILGPPPPAPSKKELARAPAGLPPYLASLYEEPLLTGDEEVYYFRKYNYLKFRAARFRDNLDVQNPTAAQVEQIEGLLRQAAETKQLLVRKNLRLVISVARKAAGGAANFFDVVSDGNLSMMRAVDKFDYSKGFKFSTYAVWAIRRNFARSIPTEFTQRSRFRTGHEELFQQSRDARSSQLAQERAHSRQHAALTKILGRLQDRERDILSLRFGLGDEHEPMTLQEVGDRLGVSKERIRQLEGRALRKLREIAEEEKVDESGNGG